MRNFKQMALVAIAIPLLLSSCGGGSGSSSDSKFFGNVPGIYAEMTAKDESLKEQFKNCSSEDEAKKVYAEAEAAEKEYSVKIEEAAKALDGKTIEIESTPEITVNSPITLTFDGFRSKTDMTPRFKLTGDAVAAQNYQSEESKGLSTGGGDLTRYKGLSQHVYLLGFDDAGTQVFSQKVAYFPIDLITDTELGVKAGTNLKFEDFTINKKNCEGCIKATVLKFSFTEGK